MKTRIVLLILLLPISSFATITVNPVTPYSYDTGSIVYYAYDSSDNNVDTDEGFEEFGLTETSYPSKMILFDLEASNISESGNLVVGILARNSSTSAVYNIPLEAAEEDSDGTPAQCSSSTCPGSYSGTSFMSAHYTSGKTIRIGFFPADLCSYLNDQGKSDTNFGCSGGSVNAPGSSAVTLMPLRFVVTNVSDSSDKIPDDLAGTESSDRQEADVDIYFQNGPPTYSCPDMNGFYFPGDGQITVDATKVTYTTSVSSGASVANLLLWFKQGGTPSFGDKDIKAVIPKDATDYDVGGFVNTTDGTDNIYQMALSVRNSAGIYATIAQAGVSGTDQNCTYQQIQTTEIQGLISGGQCFVATAAFGSLNAWPVQVLREFRDRVLQKFSLGRDFTVWYYSWSPEASRWLERNPVARISVLLGLTPVVGFAWLVMNPWVLALILLTTLGLFYVTRRSS